MNENNKDGEQENPGQENEQDAGKIFLYGDTTLQTPEEFKADKDKGEAADSSDEQVHTNIGDGTMRDEGLANEPDPGIFNNNSYGNGDEQTSGS